MAVPHAYEPSFFDFKEVLNADYQKEEHKLSICQTVCSMANTSSGFVIFGVLDQKKKVSSARERIKGIPLRDDLSRHFEEKISYIQRDVYFIPSLIRLPNDSQKGIYVVKIPLSQRRPHMLVSKGVFYRRGDGGKADPMNYYEVQEQMMYTEERMRKVILFRLEIAQYRRIILTFQQDRQRMLNIVIRFDTGAFKMMLVNICDFITPNLFQHLIDIPLHANIINELLNRAQYQGLRLHVPGQENPDEQRREAIITNLDYLDKLCVLCEQGMGEIFGSLNFS